MAAFGAYIPFGGAGLRGEVKEGCASGEAMVDFAKRLSRAAPETLANHGGSS
jgi:hypothetical protein